jgi:cytochrome c5
MNKNLNKHSKSLAHRLIGRVIIPVAIGFLSYSAAARESAGASDEATAKRIAPVGQVKVGKRSDPTTPVAEQPTPAAAKADPEDTGNKGKKVYESACFMCHTAGVAGAPKLGDKQAWAPRISQGMDILVEHAIQGFQGSAGLMPPRGGRSDLTDEDIRAAVDYMVSTSQ